MAARIYKPARSAMQSGRSKAQDWLLELEAEARRGSEPLMGWTSTTDTRQQVTLSFATREAAIAYAQRKGLTYEVLPEPPVRSHKKSYSDNFRWGRPDNWTH